MYKFGGVVSFLHVFFFLILLLTLTCFGEKDISFFLDFTFLSVAYGIDNVYLYFITHFFLPIKLLYNLGNNANEQRYLFIFCIRISKYLFL